MKKIIALLVLTVCFFTASAQYRSASYRSIGVRLGDPMGVTYKRYIGKTKAVEFLIGTSSPAWHNAYYRNSFNSRDAYENYTYRSHTVESTLYLQARYLLHYNIYVEGMPGKWDWYWGLGGMLKFARVKYWFQDELPPFKQSDVYNDVDFGPEGIAGMEYTFDEVPITVFAEVSLMLELFDRVSLRPYSGAGARYRF